jgi:ubiquinone/menaquinone biosynthesis C-methylase UbiE
MRAKADLRGMYDALAPSYSGAYSSPAGRYFMSRKIDAMLSMAEFSSGDRLLEVGCADGVYTLEVAMRGFRVTGVDLSPECVRVAAERARRDDARGVSFAVADAETLVDLADASFDGAFSFSTLRYLYAPQAAVAQIRRVIRPGAVAVVDFPNRRSPWFTLLKPLLTGRTHVHDHHYTTSEAAAMMRAAGFREIEARRILFTPKTTPDWALPVMRAVDFLGERTPGLNRLASIIVVRGRR